MQANGIRNRAKDSLRASKVRNEKKRREDVEEEKRRKMRKSKESTNSNWNL